QVVGSSFEFISTNGAYAERAVLWTNSSSPPLDLGAVGLGTNSIAYSINDSNRIVGTADDGWGHWVAAYWPGGSGSGLLLENVPFGVFDPGVLSEALGVNRSGQMVGYSLFRSTGACGPSLSQPAMLWDPDNVTGGILPSPNATNAAKAIN